MKDKKINVITRSDKRKNTFAQVDKQPLCNPELSWKAKGILTYLLSLPNDWDIRIKELCNHASDGRDSTTKGIEELIEKGYVIRQRRRIKGQFKGYMYFVFETPDLSKNGKTDYGKTVIGKPENGISKNGKTDYGKPEPTNNILTNNILTNNILTNNNQNNKEETKEALSENFSGEHAADTEPKNRHFEKRKKVSQKTEKDWTANEEQLLRQIRRQEARMAGGELIEEEQEEQPFSGQKQEDWEWFQKTYNRPVNMHDQVVQFARLSSADIEKIKVHLPGYIELLKAAKTPLKYWKKPHNYLKDRIYLDAPITQQEIEQAKNGNQKANTNRKGHQFNSDKQELVNSFFV